MRWEPYHQKVTAPNRMVVGAFIKYVRNREAALDLGAGNLRDSKFLLRRGFRRVVAVDNSHDSLKYVVPGIELVAMSIQGYFPDINTFNFAFSCNTLIFLKPSHVYPVFARMWRVLKQDGVFVCNLFGPDTDWVKRGEAWGWDQTGIEKLSEPFEVLEINRSKSFEAGVSGKMEHWDQWQLVLRRP